MYTDLFLDDLPHRRPVHRPQRPRRAAHGRLDPRRHQDEDQLLPENRSIQTLLADILLRYGLKPLDSSSRCSPGSCGFLDSIY